MYDFSDFQIFKDITCKKRIKCIVKSYEAVKIKIKCIFIRYRMN
jgi:hypothetical protein